MSKKYMASNPKLLQKIFCFSQILLVCFCSASPEKRGRTYSEVIGWYDYQKFLPTEIRFEKNPFPKESYQDWKGLQVHIDSLGDDDTECTIILLHGAGGNGRILISMGYPLLETGCKILAPDMPGYGLTTLPDHFQNTYEAWIELASDLVDQEKQKQKKVILYGFSIGGMFAYNVAAKNKKVDGVMATTLADTRDKKVRDAVSKNLFLSRVGVPLGNLFQWMIADIHIPIRWVSKMDLITNDSEFTKVFEKDAYAGGGRVRMGWLNGLMNYSPELEPEKFQVCPVLLVHPGLDPWTPLEISKPFFERIATKNKELIVLDGAGHFPYEEPGFSQLKQATNRFVKSILKERGKK